MLDASGRDLLTRPTEGRMNRATHTNFAPLSRPQRPHFMRSANDNCCNRLAVFHRPLDGSQYRRRLLAASEWIPEGTAMNSFMLILAVLCVIIAVSAACRRDAPTATAATTGPALFALLAIILGGDHERDDC